jgi:hypothetical protein
VNKDDAHGLSTLSANAQCYMVCDGEQHFGDCERFKHSAAKIRS